MERHGGDVRGTVTPEAKEHRGTEEHTHILV